MQPMRGWPLGSVWGGPGDLYGRNGFSASRASPGVARLVPGAYPGLADGARLPRLAALPGDRRDRRALSRVARGFRARHVRTRRLSLTRRAALERPTAAIADQLAPQSPGRPRQDARCAGRPPSP